MCYVNKYIHTLNMTTLKFFYIINNEKKVFPTFHLLRRRFVHL